MVVVPGDEGLVPRHPGILTRLAVPPDHAGEFLVQPVVLVAVVAAGPAAVLEARADDHHAGRAATHRVSILSNTRCPFAQTSVAAPSASNSAFMGR